MQKTVMYTVRTGPTGDPDPDPPPVPSPTPPPDGISEGIWLTYDEIQALPTTGQAWDLVRAAANESGVPDLSNQDNDGNVITLAKALVGARLDDADLLAAARSNIMDAIGTEAGGRSLALGRNLCAVVVAADIAGLPDTDDATFRGWLSSVRTADLQGRTLISTHEDRPNNWGTMCGASRVAADIYLGDTGDLDRAATVFHGYLGNRDQYADFKYGELSWQCDPNNPVGINPDGCTKEGHDIGGVMPDDMRRGGSFTWPPGETGYPWEGLQGCVVQAEILHRQGYDAWNWEDQAIRRAVQFLTNLGWNAEGDDIWQIPLINLRYGTSFPIAHDTRGHGKIMGWTAWTHGS